MIFLLKIFCLLVTIIVTYVAQFYYHYFTRPNPLPGPFPLPLIGNAHQIIGFELSDWMMLMHKKYGDVFEVYLAGKRTIMICRPDLIENMNVPSSKTNFFNRFHMTEVFIEYGHTKGLSNNNVYESWKYNRQFFMTTRSTPNFIYQALNG